MSSYGAKGGETITAVQLLAARPRACSIPQLTHCDQDVENDDPESPPVSGSLLGLQSGDDRILQGHRFPHCSTGGNWSTSPTSVLSCSPRAKVSLYRSLAFSCDRRAVCETVNLEDFVLTRQVLIPPPHPHSATDPGWERDKVRATVPRHFWLGGRKVVLTRSSSGASSSPSVD